MNYVDPEKIRVCVQNDRLNLKSIRVISLNVFCKKSCAKLCESKPNVKPKLIVLVAIYKRYLNIILLQFRLLYKGGQSAARGPNPASLGLLNGPRRRFFSLIN